MRRHAGPSEHISAPMVLPSPTTVSPPMMVAPVIVTPIFNRRMAFLAAQRLSPRERFRDQADALVTFDVIADDGRFAHDGAGAFGPHREMRADLRAGVQVHCRCAYAPLRSLMRGMSGNVFQVKLVRRAAAPRWLRCTVRDNDFFLAERRPGRPCKRLRCRSAAIPGCAAGCPGIRAVSVCATWPQSGFWEYSAGGLVFQALADFRPSERPKPVSSRAAVSALISEEWINFSSKKPGNSRRNKSTVISAIACFDGRIFAIEVIDAAGAGNRKRPGGRLAG